MIIIIRALTQWRKDDGDYDSPTSRDETLDIIKKIKEAKEAQIKKRGQRSPPKRKKEKKREKNERKREKGQCYYPFTTLVLQSSTMFFIERFSYALTFIY